MIPQEDDGMPLVNMRPAEHNRVCWAAATGLASRGRTLATPLEIAQAAIEVLADPDECICPKFDHRGHRIKRRVAG